MSSPISGFTAVPNPMMLSFMGSQSFIMMYEAGAAWQYGKRKISAMSNEEFNKLTPLLLLQEHTQLLRSAIPTIQDSMEDMSPLVKTIMVQFGEYIAEAVKAFPAAVQAAVGGGRGELAAFGSAQALVTGAGSGTIPTGQDLVNMLVAAQRKAQEAAQIRKKDFKGPEINRETGEQSEFIRERQILPSPAPHIKERRVSNVSLQSLTIENNRLRVSVDAALSGLRLHLKTKGAFLFRRNLATWNSITTRRQAEVNAAKQKLANFIKMHGSRLR